MPEQKTILHVEDDPDLCEMLQTLFEAYSLNWVVAPTGMEGLQKVRELRPDLVILDLMLPDISGREFFLRMLDDSRLKDIPVLVLSVIWWNANRYPWYEPSVVSYVFKPFEPYELRDRVLRALGVDIE